MKALLVITGVFFSVCSNADFLRSRDRAGNRRLLEALAAGQLRHVDLLAVEDIEYGLSDKNKAWFWYKDELGHEFFYDNLFPNKNLYVTDHEDKSDVYSLIDEDHMISMLVHGADEVSISVWTMRSSASGGEQALPTFHLTSHNQIKHDDFHSARRLSNDRIASSYVAYEYDATFETGKCSAIVIRNLVDESGDVQRVTYPLDDFDFATHSLKKRSLLDHLDKYDETLENQNGVPRRRLPAKRFENCFPGENATRFLDVSFLADLGYFTSFNSDVDAVRKSVEVIVANTNLIYAFQFNIRIRLQQLYIVTNSVTEQCKQKDVDTVVSQDPRSGTCCLTLNDAETSFRKFSARASFSRPSGRNVMVEVTESTDLLSGISNAAHWHLLSDCYPANCGEKSCGVGMAAVNGSPNGTKALACKFDGRNVAVSSRTFQTWLTFAHELGHNFGGLLHSFEDGIGNTGGIMDYGSGKIGSTYEFNKYRKSEFCEAITEIIEDKWCENPSGTLNYFTFLKNPCDDQPDFTRFAGLGNFNRDCGICLNNTCTPMQLLLKVNDESTNETDIEGADPDRFPYEFLVEPAEFSPLTIDEESIITAELFVSNPIDACSELSGPFVGTIVIARRGGCVFKQKVQNALNAGALAIIIFNNDPGAPKPIGGEGYIDIAAVGISRNDGEEILDLISVSSDGRLTASIGGFAASNKEMDFIPQTLFEEYKVFILTFIGLAIPGCILWVAIRYNDKLAIRAAKLKENIVDAAIENKYKVVNAYERVSMSIRRPDMMNFLRVSAIPPGAEEIGARARQDDAGSDNEGGDDLPLKTSGRRNKEDYDSNNLRI